MYRKYRDLILYLQHKPLANNNEIAKQLGVTLPTVRKYLSELKSEAPEPIILGTYGELDHRKLGLEFSYYLVNLEPGSDNKRKLFELGDYHPYTNYQNSCYGSTNGFMMRFSNPKGESSKITLLLNRITETLHINGIDVFVDKGDTYSSKLNYNFWKSNRWDFNVDTWIENSQAIESKPKRAKNNQTNILKRLKLGHIITLRELSINADRKQSQIMSDIQNHKFYSDEEKKLFTKDKQRNVSRYYQFIEDNELIKSYQLLYNHKILNIYNQICLTGRMSKNNLQMLRNAYLNNSSNLPFTSGLSISKNKFLWLLYLPHEQITDFMRVGFDLSSEFKMAILDDNPKYQRIYPIWHRNFITERNQKSWRKDINWMVDDPINSISNN